MARQRGFEVIRVENFKLKVADPIFDEDKSTPFLSDAEVKKQLQDFNFFKKEKDGN
jgi:hypothetical protein